MLKEILKSARLAIILSIGIACGWLMFYLFGGFVPESTWPVHISRWWDVLLGPIYVMCAEVANIVEKEQLKKIQRPQGVLLWNNILILLLMFAGIILGLSLGLMAGMIFLFASMIFILRVARQLHSESETKKNADPIYHSPTQEEINKSWEESRWKQY